MSRTDGAPSPSTATAPADRPVFVRLAASVRRGAARAGRGTSVAIWALTALTMSALTLPSCLITQPVQFEAPTGFPPSIESIDATEFPLDALVRLRTSDTTTLMFPVEVRDPDVDETLAFQVYVDYDDDSPRIADDVGVIPTIDRVAGTDRTRRRFEFQLDAVSSRLTGAGCHRIELVVSGAFQNQSRLPVREGDLATAVWWVVTDNGSTVDMRLCP
jgi:hypothetical protein